LGRALKKLEKVEKKKKLVPQGPVLGEKIRERGNFMGRRRGEKGNKIGNVI